MNELEKDLSIDIDHLDAEWMLLPSLYLKYREEADYVDTLSAKKKMEIDSAMAALDQKCRTAPKSFLGVEKPTENAIKSYVDCDLEINKLKFELVDLSKRRKLLATAIAALEMKRDSLKNLVLLYNGEYFASRPTDGLGNIKSGEKRNIRREIKTRLMQGENDEKE